VAAQPPWTSSVPPGGVERTTGRGAAPVPATAGPRSRPAGPVPRAAGPVSRCAPRQPPSAVPMSTCQRPRPARGFGGHGRRSAETEERGGTG
jgi:hypothetical protein